MASLDEMVAYCDGLLDPAAYDDYCPNGLQVEGRAEVRRIVSGVTGCLALVEAARRAEADLVLVHHGYFWRGEPAPLTGMKGRRIRALMASGMSLLAYHLPLDGHPEVGNNRQLALRLGFDRAAPLDGLLWGTDLDSPMTPRELAGLLRQSIGREPLVLGPDRPLWRLGWCTGAAQGWIDKAAAHGCDAFISGEVSEQTFHQASELGILYLAAGHHATERYGVQALGETLAARFDLEHRFIDIDNPA